MEKAVEPEVIDGRQFRGQHAGICTFFPILFAYSHHTVLSSDIGSYFVNGKSRFSNTWPLLVLCAMDSSEIPDGLEDMKRCTSVNGGPTPLRLSLLPLSAKILQQYDLLRLRL